MGAVDQKSSAKERKERKRLQNRLNQRARRERVKIGEANNLGCGKRPYRVDRWRLGANTAANDIVEPSKPCADSPVNNGEAVVLSGDMILSPGKAADVWRLPMSADHILIHLIAHNVCRGIAANKTMMRLFANFIMADDYPILKTGSKTFCDIGVVRPLVQQTSIPPRLKPTQLQMNAPHPSWMDIFPFPNLRDNLIRKQLTFDHFDLLQDIVGDYVHVLPPAIPLGSVVSSQEGESHCFSGEETGIILWGEPHLSESWEMTSSFWAKWSRVIGECKELLQSSNNWRWSRGEEALPV